MALKESQSVGSFVAAGQRVPAKAVLHWNTVLTLPNG